jgi:hypothetical protein
MSGNCCNAYILSAIFTEAAKAGKTEEVEAIKRISPVAWRHVNLIGRFEFHKQQNQVNIDEIISALKQKTEWQQFNSAEGTAEQASSFTFLRG